MVCKAHPLGDPLSRCIVGGGVGEGADNRISPHDVCVLCVCIYTRTTITILDPVERV